MEQLSQVPEEDSASRAARASSNVPWRLLALLSLANLALTLIAIFRPFGPAIYAILYESVAIVYPLFMVYLCINGSARIMRAFRALAPASRPWRRFSPILLSMNILCFIGGQLAFLFSFMIWHEEAPFPSIPYLLMFGIYPCLIFAILLLPARGVTRLARVRILLDSLIIMTAITALCFAFVLAPILAQHSGAHTKDVVGIVYPAADLLVVFCLLLIALRSGEPALRPVWLMLLLGFFGVFLIHIVRLQEVLDNRFHWVNPVTILWAPALTMVVGAAQTIKNILWQELREGGPALAPVKLPGGFFPTSRWKSWLALVLVLGVALVILLLWIGGVEAQFQGVVAILCVGGFLVMMLIVVRQLLSVYEVGVLQAKLQKRNRALRLLNDLLEKQATTDSLTGLPNHRELTTRLQDALEEAQGLNSTCAVIFIDVDYFKAVNDTYGHPVGDAVLCELGELLVVRLRALSRPGVERKKEAEQEPSSLIWRQGQLSPETSPGPDDFSLGRWGGEEFVVILPGMEFAEAFACAESLRLAIEQHVFVCSREIRLTCSFGVAVYPYHAIRREELLINADRAMYTAKRLGRNQIRSAAEPLVLAMGMLAEQPEAPQEAEMLAVVESLIAALEARDHPTGLHARRVAALSQKLALALGLTWSEACIIGMGGLLHDLGKVAMPDSILFKHGKLSQAEIEYMARHPLVGEQILAPLPSLQEVARIVRHHHEWLNGGGYPDGLQGEHIPLGARIVAVADAYDAIISHRVYRQGRASVDALRELSKGAGKQFDPRIVETFENLLMASPRLLATGVA